MPVAQLKILIATDHNLFSNGLRVLFDDVNGLPVCNIINCTYHLVQDVNILKKDIALIDLNSRNINGIEASRRIIESFPKAQLIILSLYVNTSLIKQVKEAGIKGYLGEGGKIHNFIEAVRSLTAGDEFLGDNNQYLINDSEVRLSKSEIQMLRLIADGCTNPEIAVILNIQPETAKGYRKNLISKLNVRNTAELVAKCIRQGLIYIF